MHILVMDFQILLSPAEDFKGEYCFGVVCPSFLPLSVQLAVYGLWKVDQRRIVKSLASYH